MFSVIGLVEVEGDVVFDEVEIVSCLVFFIVYLYKSEVWD